MKKFDCAGKERSLHIQSSIIDLNRIPMELCSRRQKRAILFYCARSHFVAPPTQNLFMQTHLKQFYRPSYMNVKTLFMRL